MKRIFIWLTAVSWVLWLAGCSAWQFLNPSPAARTPTTTQAVSQVPAGAQTPGASNGAVPAGTALPEEAANGVVTLVIWVAPQYDPQADTPAASLLRDRLAEFSSQNPQVEISVRVKAVTGPAGLVDSLAAASAAAPDALPDLVSLTRQQLEVAALKGLLVPYDGLTTAMEDPDWYPYARQMAVLQGSQFGMPFAGDALVLGLRPSQINPPINNWDDILRQTQPFVFPAADPESLVTTAFYLSEGGQIEDSQGRPVLQADALSRVLAHYQTAAQQGLAPNWLADFSLDDQSWQVFREQRAPMAFTWVSHLLNNPQSDTALALLPAGSTGTATFADGWAWALASPHIERREMAVRLAEFLVAPDYLAPWSEASGTLPPRSAGLDGWSNVSLRPFLGDLSNSARLRPSEDILIAIGPVLKDAVLQVVQNQGDPAQAAQKAVDSLSAE